MGTKPDTDVARSLGSGAVAERRSADPPLELADPFRGRRAGLLVTAASCLAACHSGGGGGGPPPLATFGTGPSACVGDRAGDFSCSGIDLGKRVPLADMGGGGGNDIWGWVDATTAREYALMGMTNGTAFVDVTDPDNPDFLGMLPTQTIESGWRDIKVYADHAYIVADQAGQHGIQVFDLTRLRGATSPQTFVADVVYNSFAEAHNIAINEDTGFAYAVGTNTCNGGLHMVDITTPNNPLFAGCYSATDTHDTQCVLYGGPDPDHAGSEICVSSNEDHVEIVDVSIKSSPVRISAVTYPGTGFTHQGWLTEDHRYFLLGDELDEINLGTGTRTHVFDLTDLDAPAHLFFRTGSTAASDHNLYVVGNFVYEANYASGLRILEIGDLTSAELEERAFFDTYPSADGPGFSGAWSVYPFFPSGTLIVSDRSYGLFVLTVP